MSIVGLEDTRGIVHRVYIAEIAVTQREHTEETVER